MISSILEKFEMATSIDLQMWKVFAIWYRKFICHLDNDDRRDVFYYKDDIKKYKNVSILIGPEGDFSASEIELAIDNNFLCVTLGNSRLRTETAGIVACHLFNLMNSY